MTVGSIIARDRHRVSIPKDILMSRYHATIGSAEFLRHGSVNIGSSHRGGDRPRLGRGIEDLVEEPVQLLRLPFTQREACPHGLRDVLHLIAQGLPLRSESDVYTCLLYTSDAADE